MVVESACTRKPRAHLPTNILLCYQKRVVFGIQLSNEMGLQFLCQRHTNVPISLFTRGPHLSRRLVPAHVRTETRPIPSEGRWAFSHRRKAIRHLPEEEIIARRTDPGSLKLPPLSFCHQYKQIVKAATLGEEEESRPSTSGTGHGTIGKWERSLGRELAERQDKTRSGQGGTSGPGP